MVFGAGDQKRSMLIVKELCQQVSDEMEWEVYQAGDLG